MKERADMVTHFLGCRTKGEVSIRIAKKFKELGYWDQLPQRVRKYHEKYLNENGGGK